MVFSFFTKVTTPPPKEEEFTEPGEKNPLEGLRFGHPFRKYQQEIIELVKIKLEKGERQLHIVAPPGAGKTIIGLQLITELKVPALVVCPTTTIQAQWGQKLELFVPPELQGFGLSDVIGTAADKPLKPITLLTYQVLSTPGREIEYLQKLAHEGWVAELCSGSNLTQGEAELRIMELMQNNKKAYDKELSRHVSRLRRKLSDVLDLKEVLHPNAVSLLQAFRRQKFGVVIFDECHHLTDYWAAIMTHVVRRLDNAVVIGLTGTPPEGKSASQETRYIKLVGDIDYQVPTPALVREGGLAPFQDLVYFAEPTENEERFLEDQHIEFHALLQELVEAEPPLLSQWVEERLFDSSKDKKKEALVSRRPELAAAMVRFAWKHRIPLPANIELSESLRQSPLIDDWMAILEDFALQFLKTSASTENHKLYDRIRSAITKLGYGLTERGLRKQASPVDRVLAFSKSKPQAVARIMETEYRNLDDRLRAAVVTDFERMSATSVKAAKGVLTKDSGGAVAVLRELLDQPIGAMINPCMVTGSLLLVDKRIAEQFVQAASEYLKSDGYKFELIVKERLKHQEPEAEPENADHKASEQADLYTEADDYARVAEAAMSYDPDAIEVRVRHEDPTTSDGIIKEINFAPPPVGAMPLIEIEEDPSEPFVEITATSSEWEARLYVGMATAMLERGITKCLIGTRGIFGEGWDCQALNTLVDLTTTTTPMSVKQLRGRSIRINVSDPLGARKVANNWDVVCIAPHLEKGLNDYQRFARKHNGYFGISDDGQIECGVGHVHPSFSELTPAEVFQNYEHFNEEMCNRALCRDQIYDLWKVGHPYENRHLGCVEVSGIRRLALTPPNIRRDLTYKEHAQLMRASMDGLWLEYGGLSVVACAALTFALMNFGAPIFLALIPILPIAALGRAKYKAMFERLKAETCRPNTQESSLVDMSVALLAALQQVKLLPRHIEKKSITVTQRSDGSFRVFLDDVEPEQSEYFAKSVKELLAPVTNQPFLVPKYEFQFPRPKAARKKDKKERISKTEPSSKLDPSTVLPTPTDTIAVSTTTVVAPRNATNEDYESEEAFFKAYLQGKAEPRIVAYHPVPSLLARSEKGRDAFQNSWNKYVSAGFVTATETKPEILNKYFGIGPSLAQRMLWE